MRLVRWMMAVPLLLASAGCDFGPDFAVSVGDGIIDSGGNFDVVELLTGALGAAIGKAVSGAIFH